MAGLAATRLFAAAGSGGVALTVWALRRSGMGRRTVASRMVAFMTVLYAVYMLALVIFGIALRTGAPSRWRHLRDWHDPPGDRRGLAITGMFKLALDARAG